MVYQGIYCIECDSKGCGTRVFRTKAPSSHRSIVGDLERAGWVFPHFNAYEENPDSFKDIGGALKGVKCPKCSGKEHMIPSAIKREKIFENIHTERLRQIEKYGEQDLPLLGAEQSRASLERALKFAREAQEASGFGWLDVLMEEACEAFLEEDPARRREEMVQVAAVAVQIIEWMDRKTEVKDD